MEEVTEVSDISKNNSYEKSFQGSISKAGEYFSTRYSSLARLYTVAITSYALALLGKLDDEKVLVAASKVYRTRLIKTEESSSYDNYMMEILEVIKAGTDENPEGKTRVLISYAKCREVLKLEFNDYLIWGLRSNLWALRANISYVIGKDTWIEKWPSEHKSQEADFKNLCIEYLEFSQAITIFGCPQST